MKTAKVEAVVICPHCMVGNDLSVDMQFPTAIKCHYCEEWFQLEAWRPTELTPHPEKKPTATPAPVPGAEPEDEGGNKGTV